MGGLQEAHTGSGLAGKLGNSLLVDRIPYRQIDGRKQQTAHSNKILFLIVPLLVVLGISAVLLLVVIQTEYYTAYCNNSKQEEKLEPEKLQWNELIFTQLWGYSECIQFKDKHFPKDVTCRYENKPSYWTIHGIWPTREGSEGPSFCTRVQFNITLLDPIRPSLEINWYEIDSTKEGDYFWSHEWKKHGSCAKELDRFGTELKYFSSALDLHKKYDLYSILKSKNIVPEKVQSGKGYKLSQITDAITGSLGKSAVPYIQCLGKKDATGTNGMSYYLLAAELCFDKNLQLIACRQRKQQLIERKYGDNVLPCPSDAQIHYATL